MDDYGRTRKVISSRERFDGRVFRVRTDELRFPDGTHARRYRRASRLVCDHRNAARRFDRPGTAVPARRGASLWEIPAGRPSRAKRPSGRTPGASRGDRFAAADSRAGYALCTPGFCDEVMHFFHAASSWQATQSLDEDERITVGTFSRAGGRKARGNGQIADVKTIFALLWMRGKRGELGPPRADN